MTARKPNGRSSVYLGKDGRWHGRVTMGVRDDGSPDRRHVRGATEGEVTRKVRAIERERSAGHAAKAGRPPTVGEWMRTWLDTIAPRTASASTITSTYRPKVDRWIIPRIGGHRLDRLRPEHLDALYLGLAGEGLAPKSVAMVHQLISRALKMAHRRGIVGRNVATLVDAPTFREAEIVPLTADDARRVLTAAAGERNGARWSVALALGLRQSEALGLRWSCLDLDRGEVRVYQLKRARYAHGCRDPLACTAGRHRDSCLPGCSLHAAYCPERTGGAWAFREPKGGKARTVVIPGQLLSPLRAQRTAQAAERLAAGELWQDWDLVFARRATGRSGGGSAPRPGCGTPESTTPGTPRRRCSWSRGWTSGLCKTSSGTRRSP